MMISTGRRSSSNARRMVRGAVERPAAILQQSRSLHNLLASCPPSTAALPLAAVTDVSSSRFLSTTTEEDAKSLAAEANNASSNSNKKKKGFLGRLMDRMSIRGQHKQALTAEMLFQAATRQANDPNWYGPGRIPRDFRSRHAMLTMHLWFLHKRLISNAVDNGQGMDEDFCLKIQEELFTIFWEDTMCRLRAEPGIREMSVNKYLMQVQQYTFLHMFHYDHIFAKLQSSQSHLDEEDAAEEEVEEGSPEAVEETPTTSSTNSDEASEELMDPLKVLDPNVDLTKQENRISELKKLIWMHIMVRDPNSSSEAGGDDHLSRMAWYVECQYQNILVDWPGQYVKEARVKWVGLPSFKGMMNNKTQQVLPEQSPHPEDVLPAPWLKNITLRGEYYYWNPTNGKSQWEKPKSTTSI